MSGKMAVLHFRGLMVRFLKILKEYKFFMIWSLLLKENGKKNRRSLFTGRFVFRISDYFKTSALSLPSEHSIFRFLEIRDYFLCSLPSRRTSWLPLLANHRSRGDTG